MTAPRGEFRCVVGTLTDGDASRAVDGVWTRVERSVRRAAGKFADDDREAKKDLIQEARIKLWELDPSRIDVQRNSDIFYVRRVLINRMWSLVWAEVVRRHPELKKVRPGSA